MKAARSKFMARMLKDQEFVKVFTAAANAAVPEGSAPESLVAFEFDYNGAHYKFSTKPIHDSGQEIERAMEQKP